MPRSEVLYPEGLEDSSDMALGPTNTLGLSCPDVPSRWVQASHVAQWFHPFTHIPRKGLSCLLEYAVSCVYK